MSSPAHELGLDVPSAGAEQAQPAVKLADETGSRLLGTAPPPAGAPTPVDTSAAMAPPTPTTEPLTTDPASTPAAATTAAPYESTTGAHEPEVGAGPTPGTGTTHDVPSGETAPTTATTTATTAATTTPVEPHAAGASPIAHGGTHGALHGGTVQPSADSAADNEANIAKLNKIIKGTRTCMLTTIGEQGLHSRPMSTAGLDWEVGKKEYIYFVTDRDCAKVAEIKAHPEVALAFSNDATNSWASVSATAEVIEDREKTREVWSSAFNAFFPGGPESPNVALIKATPCCGTFWEGSYFTRLHILFSSLKARITGTTPLDQGLIKDTKTVIFPSPASSTAEGGQSGVAGAAAAGLTITPRDQDVPATTGGTDASLASMGEGVPPTSTLENLTASGTTGGTISGTSDMGVADQVATARVTSEGVVPELATPTVPHITTPSTGGSLASPGGAAGAGEGGVEPGPPTPTAAAAAAAPTPFTINSYTPAGDALATAGKEGGATAAAAPATSPATATAPATAGDVGGVPPIMEAELEGAGPQIVA